LVTKKNTFRRDTIEMRSLLLLLSLSCLVYNAYGFGIMISNFTLPASLAATTSDRMDMLTMTDPRIYGGERKFSAVVTNPQPAGTFLPHVI